MVNSAIFTGLSRCILWILVGTAVVVFTPSARSTVIWTFHETSCTAFDGSNCTFQPPGGLAQLTLPDVDSSGAWSGFYNATTHTFTETGDTNFLFQLNGSSLQAPGFHPASPADLISNIEFDIVFASSRRRSLSPPSTPRHSTLCASSRAASWCPGFAMYKKCAAAFLSAATSRWSDATLRNAKLMGTGCLRSLPSPRHWRVWRAPWSRCRSSCCFSRERSHRPEVDPSAQKLSYGN